MDTPGLINSFRKCHLRARGAITNADTIQTETTKLAACCFPLDRKNPKDRQTMQRRRRGSSSSSTYVARLATMLRELAPASAATRQVTRVRGTYIMNDSIASRLGRDICMLHSSRHRQPRLTERNNRTTRGETSPRCRVSRPIPTSPKTWAVRQSQARCRPAAVPWPSARRKTESRHSRTCSGPAET